MDKVKKLETQTANYYFEIELSRDSDEFVAKLSGQTPKIPEYKNLEDPHTKTSISTIIEEELRDKNEEKLLRKCEARMQEIDGPLLFPLSS